MVPEKRDNRIHKKCTTTLKLLLLERHYKLSRLLQCFLTHSKFFDVVSENESPYFKSLTLEKHLISEQRTTLATCIWIAAVQCTHEYWFSLLSFFPFTHQHGIIEISDILRWKKQRCRKNSWAREHQRENIGFLVIISFSKSNYQHLSLKSVLK